MTARFLTIAISSVLLLGTSCAVAQTNVKSASKVIEQAVENAAEKQGGSAGTVWKQPWRFVILFNSSQAKNKSAYTNSVLSGIHEFLGVRSRDGQPHRVSFYPYQLDVYREKAQCVEDLPLNADAINQIDKVFPRIPFKYLADGKTPYPVRGGHDNLMARQIVAESLPTFKGKTLVVQFTDIVISESPGQVEDEVRREQDQRPRGVEKAGLKILETSGGTISTEEPRQSYTVLLYGSEQVVNDSAPGSGPNLAPILTVLGVLAGLAGLGVAGWMVWSKFGGVTGKGFIVTFPGNGPVFLSSKKDVVGVYGKGGNTGEAGPSVILYLDEAPAAKLFEMHRVQNGVKFVDNVWKVSTFDGKLPVVLTHDDELILEDPNANKRRTVKIRIEKEN